MQHVQQSALYKRVIYCNFSSSISAPAHLVHFWTGPEALLAFQWRTQCDHLEGKPHQFWPLWCVASSCPLTFLGGGQDEMARHRFWNTWIFILYSIYIPTPLTPNFKGGPPKCNVHFFLGGGEGWKCTWDPPHVGSRGGGWGGKTAKKNVTKGLPPPSVHFF